MDLINFDVFGPIKVLSISKALYYVSFIDDYSRKTQVYFLKSNCEVFNRFKKFNALLKNNTSGKIKVLRIDNGGEFCSTKFDQFYKDSGIKIYNTTLYTP